jgi:CheY-like chemotaxis protein
VVRPATILICEDEPSLRELMRLSLTGDYAFAEAGDVAEALELVDSVQPDLVLLDVMMPGKSGWEVARALKQDPVTQAIKIVMVTAIGEQVNEITSPLYGADAHIDKPFEFERLERIIGGLLMGR